MADELSRLNFLDDLTEAKSVDEAACWSIDHRGDLEAWITLSPRGQAETYIARLSWIEYPGNEPPSVKFVDPTSGRLDFPSAWPRARGFRPTNLDICASWTSEGFGAHPEWKNDPRYKWSSHGNVLLKLLRTLQDELDEDSRGKISAMSYFEIPAQWRLPDEAIRHSMSEMAIAGAAGHEGVAMWLGRYERDVAIVSHVAVLRGPGVRKAPDQLFIATDLVNDLTDTAMEHGLVLIGQIHSHGPMHGTSLSLTDKTYGIAVPGYLSVVAPDYALRPSTGIQECGVHIYDKPHGWIRLTSEQVAERVVVVAGARVPVLAVGSI